MINAVPANISRFGVLIEIKRLVNCIRQIKDLILIDLFLPNVLGKLLGNKKGGFYGETKRVHHIFP